MPDDGRDAHDLTVIRSTRDKAIEMVRVQDVEIDSEENKMALQLFPRVSINLSQLSYMTLILCIRLLVLLDVFMILQH